MSFTIGRFRDVTSLNFVPMWRWSYLKESFIHTLKETPLQAWRFKSSLVLLPIIAKWWSAYLQMFLGLEMGQKRFCHFLRLSPWNDSNPEPAHIENNRNPVWCGCWVLRARMEIGIKNCWNIEWTNACNNGQLWEMRFLPLLYVATVWKARWTMHSVNDQPGSTCSSWVNLDIFGLSLELPPSQPRHFRIVGVCLLPPGSFT